MKREKEKTGSEREREDEAHTYEGTHVMMQKDRKIAYYYLSFKTHNI